MLEAMQHRSNAFVTLTYEDTKLVASASGLSTLVPRDLQLFLKRLRERSPQKLRFFAVGEYGDQTFRPHYHVGLFNFPNCQRGQTHQSHTGRRLWSSCCGDCRMVGETWGKGDIEIRSLEASKCEYLAGYVTKKMTSAEDPRLEGRFPEFSRQSRGGRAGPGGIGFSGVERIAKAITQFVEPSQLIDVPPTIKQGKNAHLPLGRYIRNKLREQLGLEGASREVLHEAWLDQVYPLWQKARASEKSFAAVCAEENAPYEAALRAKLNSRKGKI